LFVFFTMSGILFHKVRLKRNNVMENNPWGNGSSGGSNGHRFDLSWRAGMAFGWVAFLILLCLFVFWQSVLDEQASVTLAPDEAQESVEIPLPGLSSGDQLALGSDRMLDVNGQLRIKSSIVISPTDAPSNPIAGQIYYDSELNVPMYYDGEKFVEVGKQDDIRRLQSAPSGERVVVERVVSSTTVVVSDESNGDAVIPTANTNGSIVKFGPGNTITNSLLTESGSVVSLAGTLSLSTNDLQFGSGAFVASLNTVPLSADRSISLPDASGTICLQNSTSCGFMTGTATQFIQNQNMAAQTGTNFWVAGTGRVDGGVITPSVDTTAGGTLMIGSNASAVDVNADTTVNGNLGVSTSSSVINIPLLQLEQNGSGDTTIELKNSQGGSFYVGMDQSAGGTLRIGSSTAARTTSSVGLLTPGASGFPNVDSQIIARKITTGPADDGSLSSIRVYLSAIDGAATGVKVALYSHDATNDRPGTLVASTSTAAAGSVGWNALPLSAPITNNTTYWIAVNIEGGGTRLGFNYCACGVDSTSTYPRAFNSPWPVEHGPPTNLMSDYEWSMYMDVASGGVNDTYAGAKLFSMTASGALTLQNSVNTTSAFQVQDAAGVALLNVNSATGVLVVRDQSVVNDLTVGGSVYVANLDVASPGTLNVASNNATTVNVANGTGGHTVNIATGVGSQIVNIGSASNSSGTYIQGGSNHIFLNSSSDIRAQFDGVYTFGNRAGDYNMVINAATNEIVSQYGTSMIVQGALRVDNSPAVFNAGITIGNTGSLPSFTTPLGAQLQTAINIPSYTMQPFGTVLAFGLDRLAPDSARALLVADARESAHQPTIGVLSPNESDIFGLSWDGSNGTARLKTLGAGVGIRLNATDVAQFENGQTYLNQNTRISGNLELNGNSVFTPTTDSTDAFRIQGADTSAVLLRADTLLNKIVIRTLDVEYNLTVLGDISVGRHLRSGGSAPTTVTGPAACTSPTVTVSGTDTSGMVTVVAGTGCGTNGAVMAVMFANAFASAPKVTLTPATATAASLPAYVDYAQVTAASFDIASATPLADGVSYRWYYHAIE
jgi:hypothetical protein